jgi:hypothetical protein
MLTIRLDPTLEEQTKRAAATAGISVSAFVRRALEKECQSARDERLDVLLADVIGSVASREPCDDARRTGEALKEILARNSSS